ERVRRAHDREVYGQPGAADLVEHVAYVLERRRRGGLELLRRAAQDAEQPAQLGERLPGRAADDLHRALGLGGPAGRRRGGSLAWARHEADVMRDDVVQLAGDPVRSATAARDVWRSSSASARSARLSAACRLARFARLSTPAAHAVTKIRA